MSISKNKIYAVLIGDIVGSRTRSPEEWLPVLEHALAHYSSSFDIYRGDSFQLMVEVDKILEAYFYIKARIKTVGALDVRMSIGIGTIDYEAGHIKVSSGEAFVRSGEAFETLQKDLVAVQSPWSDWDEMASHMLQLSVELANKWTNNMAETVAVSIANPLANQQELAALLNRKYQSQVSTELNKSNWLKINRSLVYCTSEMLKKC